MVLVIKPILLHLKRNEKMIMFAATKVALFVHTNKSLRYGQQFHHHMNLEKVTNPIDKQFCDRIYYAEESLAKGLIRSRVDRNG